LGVLYGRLINGKIVDLTRLLFKILPPNFCPIGLFFVWVYNKLLVSFELLCYGEGVGVNFVLSEHNCLLVCASLYIVSFTHTCTYTPEFKQIYVLTLGA
jgi:hypothetical protein